MLHTPSNDKDVNQTRDPIIFQHNLYCTSKSKSSISLCNFTPLALLYSQRSFLPRVMESLTNDITIITDRVVKGSEPDVASFCTEEQEARRETTYPSESVDRRVHNERTSEHWEHSSR
ncbi:hypothetical protein Bca101_015477 [Brassica carinata]